MNRKPTLSKLTKRADGVFSLWIRKRDNGICICCGSRDNIQCGHLIRRGRWSVRYHEDNCHAQCSRCNFKHNQYPDTMNVKVLAKIGAERFTTIYAESQVVKKKTRAELESIIQKYKEGI